MEKIIYIWNVKHIRFVIRYSFIFHIFSIVDINSFLYKFG